MLSPGAVSHGEGDCVPAKSSSGEVSSGGVAVLPAPPHRELQAAVERRPGGRLLLHQTQRCNVRFVVLVSVSVSFGVVSDGNYKSNDLVQQNLSRQAVCECVFVLLCVFQAACVTAGAAAAICCLCWTRCWCGGAGGGEAWVSTCWRISAPPSPRRSFWESALRCHPAWLQVG